MSEPAFGRRARCGALVLLLVVLSACSKKAEVGAPAPPVPDPPPQQPQPPKQPRPAKGTNNGAAGGLGAVGGLLGASAPLPAEAQALKEKYQALLVGTWAADLGDGFREELTYNADGTFTAKLTGPTPATAAGKYAVVQSIGTKGLKVRHGDGPTAKTVVVSFDNNEMEHPSLRPGVTGTYRKK